MSEDVTVFVYNDNAFVNGSYKVTSEEVEWFDDNTVVIGTDYKYREESWLND